MGGVGGEQFAFNTGYYGHACKIIPSGNIDVTGVSAEISRITTTQTFALSIYADSGGKPSGTALGTGNISSTVADCHVYTATFATTSLTSGVSYWLVAEPTTHSTAYICGAGADTVSDKDSSNVWSASYGGAYYFTATFSTSTGGGGGGGSAVTPGLGIGITVASSTANVNYDPAQTIFYGIFLFLFTFFGMLTILSKTK